MSKMGGKMKSAVVRIAPTKNYFKTKIHAQMAAAGPPLGPMLGNYGINIGNFCKDFNERTKNIKKGIPLPITVKIKPDRSYDIQMHTPPIGYYLKQAAGIERGSKSKTISGKITVKHIYEIAKIKHEDPYSQFQLLELRDVVQRVARMAIGTGIQIVKEINPEIYQRFLIKRRASLKKAEERAEEKKKARLQRS